MIHLSEIRSIHLEISSLCNARCPECPRNFRGYPYNDGYIETNLTLESCKRIFTPEFIGQLRHLMINGNFGDAVMNPETPEIVEYFKSHNSRLVVEISTNGSARDKEFWQRLAKSKTIISFCLDGLEDTHHLYRQNTSWKTILHNAKIFIDAGGSAIWKMIKFDHNEHQIAACEELSKELKFDKFDLFDHGRNFGPVYDKHGKLLHVMGKHQGETSFEVNFHKKRTNMVLVEDIVSTVKSNLDCFTKKNKSIYVSSTGEVYPCCWTGFSPKTYGHGEYLEAVNSQLAPMIKNNNALVYTLEECIGWFNAVEESWKKTSFKEGKLICCNDNCGING
jgi:MoaA/NifB/PqqE/SkfB family radical SAM enzyme